MWDFQDGDSNESKNQAGLVTSCHCGFFFTRFVPSTFRLAALTVCRGVKPGKSYTMFDFGLSATFTEATMKIKGQVKVKVESKSRGTCIMST